jgi:hypothetical protein
VRLMRFPREVDSAGQEERVAAHAARVEAELAQREQERLALEAGCAEAPLLVEEALGALESGSVSVHALLLRGTGAQCSRTAVAAFTRALRDAGAVVRGEQARRGSCAPAATKNAP